MALLGIQAGRDKDSLQTLDYLDNPQGMLTCMSISIMQFKKNQDTEFTFFLGSLPPCPPNDIFLCKLIQKDSIEGSRNDEITNFVEKALALRQSSTRELLELINGTVDDQMNRIEDIDQVLQGDLSAEGMIHMRYHAMMELYCFY